MKSRPNSKNKLLTTAGFTFIETLVGLAIFAIVSTSIYLSYSNVLDIITAARFNTFAVAAMESEVEIIKNMDYADIGILGGSPPGKLLASKNITVDGTTVTLNTFVRNVDDPFDGTIGGNPNDLSPADYKLIEMEVQCQGCRFSAPRFTTTVAPKNLEGASKNGSLFISALNANGDPVSGVTVNVTNNSVVPPISITDLTAQNGELQLVDIATSSGGYRITLTKNGYSQDKTYTPGDISNPNPLKPHATVAKQQLTRISFQIDRVSTLNFRTQNNFCQAVPSVDLVQTGVKLIGANPDVIKYSKNITTDAQGNYSDSTIEWDTYTFTNTDTEYGISGENFFSPLIIDPNTTHNLTWNVVPKQPSALLVSARNAAGQPISDAGVQLVKSGYSATQYTGRGAAEQTLWGPGEYDSKSQNIDIDTQPGTVQIASFGGVYASESQEWIISKTFDLGTDTTSFFSILWNPAGQPQQAGPDSLKFQLAANNDDSTWNFVGPDGTANTYYSNNGEITWNGLNGNRYLRYKAYLYTADETVTPSLDDIRIEFASACIPSDQTYFSGLAAGTYTLTITKPGYQTYSDPNIQINSDWREYKAVLNP